MVEMHKHMYTCQGPKSFPGFSKSVCDYRVGHFLGNAFPGTFQGTRSRVEARIHVEYIPLYVQTLWSYFKV